MNQEEIKKILPHRDNMLLVEESEVVDEVTAKGLYAAAQAVAELTGVGGSSDDADAIEEEAYGEES